MYRLNRAARVASRWLKRSGMLEAPPRMVRSITDWVSESLEGGSNPLEPGGKVAKKFPLDLRGWKYGDRLKDVLDYELKMKVGVRDMLKERMKENPDLVTDTFREFLRDVERDLKSGNIGGGRLFVEVNYPRRSPSTLGAWQPALDRLTINLHSDLRPRDVHRIVEHELRHAGQTWLSKAVVARGGAMEKSLVGLAGMPSRHIRTPGVSQTGHGGDSYYLDDVEFYPNLADAVLRMRKVLDHPRVSPEQRPESFKMLVGLKRIRGSWRDHNVGSLDPFFLALKHGSREKYRKALSEAYKALF